jgi:hypothetical protein
MTEQIFSMEVLICERFPALDPFQVRQLRAVEFFRVVGKLIEHDRKEKKNKDRPNVIRRPAGDDWF